MGLPAVLFDASIFAPLERREDAEQALYWLLEALAWSNVAYLRAHPDTPRFFDAVGLRYLQDPPGREWWKGVERCLGTGVADCKSLAAWRVAECRLYAGEDGKQGKGLCRFELRRYEVGGGRVTYHVTLIRGDDTTEDPSSVLGMGAVR